jgi:hypothetical protein
LRAARDPAILAPESPVHGPDPTQVTLLLRRLSAGDAAAANDLMPLVYGELRALAAGLLRDEGARHTLQPTALVHESYLRLAGAEVPPDWEGHPASPARRPSLHRLQLSCRRPLDSLLGKRPTGVNGPLDRTSLTA